MEWNSSLWVVLLQWKHLFSLGPTLSYLHQPTLPCACWPQENLVFPLLLQGTFTSTLLGKQMEKWGELSHSEFIFIEVNFQGGRLWTICWSLLICVELCEHERLWVLSVTVQRLQWHAATLQKANVPLTSLLPVKSDCGLLHLACFYKG